MAESASDITTGSRHELLSSSSEPNMVTTAAPAANRTARIAMTTVILAAPSSPGGTDKRNNLAPVGVSFLASTELAAVVGR